MSVEAAILALRPCLPMVRAPRDSACPAGQPGARRPRAFQKYETGDLLPSQAIGSALVLLDHDPSALEVLMARQGGGRLGRRASAAGDAVTAGARGLVRRAFGRHAGGRGKGLCGRAGPISTQLRRATGAAVLRSKLSATRGLGGRAPEDWPRQLTVRELSALSIHAIMEHIWARF